MPERIVFAALLPPDAEEYLQTRFPAPHELRIRPRDGVTDDDLAWATGLCSYTVPAARIAARPNLRWLHVPGAGIDPFVDLPALRPDLRLTRHGPFNAAAVAEHGLALLLALRRGVPEMVTGKAQGRWVREAIFQAQPSLVRGTEAQVLGFGPVARALAALLAAIGARVTVFRREAAGADPAVARFCPLRDLRREIGRADAVFGVLPAVPATRHLVDAGLLAAMKSTAVVVNLGRSALVDHAALVHALQSGALAGAALDVFDEEPLPTTSPLWSAPNLIISPHVAGQFRGASRRGVEIFLGEFEAFVHGLPPVNPALPNSMEPEP